MTSPRNSLVARLGFGAQEKVAIIVCDELGFCHSANVAIYEALRAGRACSASLMVPAPWARQAAAEYRGEDVGVHLTLNSELDLYRFGPITQAPSLLDGDGGFPRTIDDVWEHADLDEVRREWRAQIERALLWGFGLTHLDAHLGGVELKPEFFDIYLDLADEFSLALRLPDDDERLVGFPFRELAHERGLVAPDRVIALSSLGGNVKAVRSALKDLVPGVTEIHLHPAVDSAELRAADPDWEHRRSDGELLANLARDEVFAEAGIRVVGYAALRELVTDRLSSSA